ncbi:MAG: hypothetical protein GX595_09530 [Lentisphaerae bacterium]|nr:hypothetical protein [Lentisphaerota bacterium]
MAQRRLAGWAVGALVVVWCLGVCAQDSAWKHPDALARLRISVQSTYPHQLRVDLPEGLPAAPLGLAAYGPGGSRVPASPVMRGERLVAAWLAVGRLAQAAMAPGDDGVLLPVEIYLLKTAEVPAPLSDAQRRPARLQRVQRALTTRPFTGSEGLRLLSGMASRGRPIHAVDVEAIGALSNQGQTIANSERRVGLLCWSSMLDLATATTAAFGAAADADVAWFIVVDGQPRASWKESGAADDGRRWGAAAELAAGLHTVEVFVVQRQNDALPSFFWKAGDAPGVALTGSCPAVHPEAVEVQLAPGGPSWGVRLESPRRSLFEDTGADLVCVSPMAVDGGPLAGVVAVFPDGRRVDASALSEGLVVPSPWLPAFEAVLPAEAPAATAVRLPGRPAWGSPLRLRATCQIDTLPPVLAASSPLPLQVTVTVGDDDSDERLRAVTRVLARQVNAAGESLSESTIGAGRPGVCRGEVVLHPEAVRLSLEVRAGGALLTPAQVVRVVRSDAGLSGLRAAGVSLFQEGERAVLVCQPLRALPPGPTEPAGRLGLLDDICAILETPGASLLPERLVGQSWTPPALVLRESLSDGVGDGVLPGVEKFAALARLLEMRPDTVVLAVGAADLRRGRPVAEVCRDLLFLAQACAAAGARPVLLALPELPGVPPATSRQAALLCKELAWRLGCAVIDAHSAERRGGLAGEAFAATFSVAGGRIALAGPNDRGREWLCQLMDRALADLQAVRRL